MTNQTIEKQEASKALTKFKYHVEADKLLHLLDELIDGLERDPSPDNEDIVMKALSRYQIITMAHNGESRWMTAPAEIHWEVIDHHIGSRIMRLLKTGDWMTRQSQNTRVMIHSAAAVPLKVPMTGTTSKEDVLDETASANAKWLLLTLRTLQTIVRMESKDGPIGVFEKPYGVTNMNRLNSYLDSMGGDIRAMVENMTVHALDTIVKDAVFTVND